MPPRREIASTAWKVRLALVLTILATGALVAGGMPGDGHRGPGGRSQQLALTPLQELELGQQAYQEVLKKASAAGKLIPKNDRRVERVRHIGTKIIDTARENVLLQREINLDLNGYRFEPA